VTGNSSHVKIPAIIPKYSNSDVNLFMNDTVVHGLKFIGCNSYESVRLSGEMREINFTLHLASSAVQIAENPKFVSLWSSFGHLKLNQMRNRVYIRFLTNSIINNLTTLNEVCFMSDILFRKKNHQLRPYPKGQQ